MQAEIILIRFTSSVLLFPEHFQSLCFGMSSEQCVTILAYLIDTSVLLRHA